MNTINLSEIIIKPITNEQEFEEANKIIDALIDADMIEDPTQREKALAILDAVSTLVHHYEKKHYSIPKPDPIEAIKERMEQLNLNQKDIAEYFGGKNRVSEVLNHKRPLTTGMIKAISKNLHISVETLLGASK